MSAWAMGSPYRGRSAGRSPSKTRRVLMVPVSGVDRMALRQAGSNSYRSKGVRGATVVVRISLSSPSSSSTVRALGRANQVTYREGRRQAGRATESSFFARRVSRVSRLPSVSRSAGTSSGRS